MAEYQLQLHEILDDGTDIFMYPINTALDVKVGKLSTGSLSLPGSASDEILAQTLANIKKYLANLSTVAAESRGVSSSTTSSSEIDLATSKAVNDLKTRIDGNDELLATHTTEIAGKAPINHATNDLKYGGATGGNYGHVKLSDTYATAVANGSAQYSVGASQAAVFNAYNALNNAKAPNDHAVAATTYGIGTASLYGHVKLSDTYDSIISNGGAANGLAASQNALYNAYAALKSVNDTQTTQINGKAPTVHSSSAAATYGASTGSTFGHVKLSDSFNADNSATGAAANSIAASSWAVYRAYSTLSVAVNTKLAATHADEKATASKFSHVKLTDTYTASGGAASSGVAPSSAALYNAYAALLGKITSAESSISTLNSRCDTLNTGKANTNHTHSYLPLSGGTMSGSINIATSTTNAYISVSSGSNKGTLQSTSTGNFGLRDNKNNVYIFLRDADDVVRVGSSDLCLEIVGYNGIDIKSDMYLYHDLLIDNHVIYGIDNDGTSGTLVKLLSINSSSNIHMGDYDASNISPVYMHAEGTQYDFCKAVFRNHTTNAANLGDGSHLWKQLFAKTATISTSDKNLKKNMKKIDSRKLQLLLNIIPKEFMFKDGDRTHMGLVAQDVEDEMNKLGLTSTDIAGLCKDILYDYDINPEDGIEIESSKRPKLDESGNIMYRYGFRYEELITPILALVQILWKQVFGDLTITK